MPKSSPRFVVLERERAPADAEGRWFDAASAELLNDPNEVQQRVLQEYGPQ